MTQSLGLGLPVAGQAVRWSGYLVPPRSDNYTLSVLLLHASASVYIDGLLVFDSGDGSGDGAGSGAGTGTGTGAGGGIQLTLPLAAETPYEIEVSASVAPAAYNFPVSLELVWSTPTVKQHRVPQFFLYPDGAEDLAGAPFPVAVNQPIP